MKWTTLLVLLYALACPAQQQSAPAESAQQLFSFTHPAMGTTYSLFLYADSQQAAAEQAERAFAEIDDVEALLSNYQPQSELSRINRLAASQPITTDPETFSFLTQSLAWSARSDGAFDITVGALMKAWGFFRSSGHVPSPAELDAVRAKTGWQRVRLVAQGRTASFAAPGVELDPGGIGKGFAVDRVVAILRSEGTRAALLSAGSSTIYGLGAPPGQPGWRVEIPDPENAHAGHALSTVLLRDTSLSTASCAEKHFILAGHLYCHIMDPRLLRPVEGRLQVTVITPSATDGDALSNVLFVEDDKERAAFMRKADSAISAVVIDGIPGDAESRCLRYRWPGTVSGSCSAVEENASSGSSKETR